MSLVFNDTTNFRGIIQEIERECGFNQGDISGNTARLKHFTASINLAHDDFIRLALDASGTWQFDDSNHTDYPIITTNIVSGQRDYSFTVDGSSNLILEIYKVLIADSGGTFREIKPRDVQSETDTLGFSNSNTGAPNCYDKTANGIFLDPIPNYNATGGLKLYINREGSYFTTSDTTKKPGVPGIFHRYYVLRPSEDYARRNSLAIYPAIRAERMQMEEDAKAYFGRRERDVRHRLVPASHSNK